MNQSSPVLTSPSGAAHHDIAAPQRLHALDNLRGCMMWLGIVLHAAVNHITASAPIPWRDSQTSPLADLLMLFIHSFRMPVFFILAGFFMARLAEQHGPQAMLRHRLRRLGLPLLLFWPFLMAATGALVLMFVHLMKRGTIGFDISLMADGPRPARLSTLHLWFMVDLLWLALAASLCSRLATPAVAQRMQALTARLSGAWWGGLCLAAPLALIGTRYPHGMLAPSMSFIPDVTELAHYGLFVLVGWCLYGCREQALARLAQTWGRHALIGCAGFVASMAVIESARLDWLVAWLYTGTAWYFSFALIGWFAARAAGERPWLGYLAASSYWVYLVHMLGTIGFGVLMYKLPWGFGVKLAANIVATSAVCLVTYELLVRRTWLGVLLNGRRVPAAAAAGVRHSPQR